MQVTWHQRFAITCNNNSKIFEIRQCEDNPVVSLAGTLFLHIAFA
jgi:hypothetical protein